MSGFPLIAEKPKCVAFVFLLVVPLIRMEPGDEPAALLGQKTPLYVIRNSAYFFYTLFIAVSCPLFFYYVLPTPVARGVPPFLPGPEAFLMRTYVYIQLPVAKGQRLLNQALKSVTFSADKKPLAPATAPSNDIPRFEFPCAASISKTLEMESLHRDDTK